jgi:uncharacterized protein with GYD domain
MEEEMAPIPSAIFLFPAGLAHVHRSAAGSRRGFGGALLKHIGGCVFGLYYTPGAEYDGFALLEAPNNVTAAAMEIADVGAGHLTRNRLTRVFSAEKKNAMLLQTAAAPSMAPKFPE